MGEENTGELHVARRIDLDYVSPPPDLLGNLSGCAADGPRLWTVSDEGRTIETLERHMSGYRLTGQIRLDQFIAGIPGDADDELDLESLDFTGSALWVCGAHCKARRKPGDGELISSEIRERRSRRLLARLTLDADGTPVKTEVLPFADIGSLRNMLEQDVFLSPFRELPTKENGIDIEGLAVLDERVFVGLRGPLVGGLAVVLELSIDAAFMISSIKRHFLKLGGLAVRELARDGSNLLVIAGPVGEAPGPFELYRWTPENGASAAKVFDWGLVKEKPEGLCQITIEGETGWLVFYDSPADRVNGTTYEADWLLTN